MNIQTDINSIKALLLTAGRKDVRYYLNGVHVEYTGSTAYMVSTNGHMLLLNNLKNEDEDTGEVTIPREALESAVKQWSKKPGGNRKAPEVIITNEAITTVAGSTPYTPVDAKYVPWRRVIPKTPTGKIADGFSFDIPYLAAFGEVAQFVTGSRFHYTLHADDARGALVTFSADDWVGVLSPMRSGSTFAAPKWLVDL